MVTDAITDICDSRVAFATEKTLLNKATGDKKNINVVGVLFTGTFHNITDNHQEDSPSSDKTAEVTRPQVNIITTV